MLTELETAAGTAAWSVPLVEDFSRGNNDVLVLDRAPLVSVWPAIRTGRVHEYRSLFTAADVDTRVTDGLEALQIECPVLAADIACLARSFLNQFGQTEANLRIEMVQRQSCPKFHCDNVHIRLVTTYHGPTTEYQFTGEDAIHAAPLYGLVFLKGHQHPTHRDSVHHRSPEMTPGTNRLCVVIDY